jgi:hypothetical protein
MRLVHPSRKRELLSVLAVLVLGLCASLLAVGHDADARPARPAQVGTVVPDGTYGGLDRGSGEYVVFKVRNRRVFKLAFNTKILCQASDSSNNEPRFFSAAHAPQGRTIPRNGRLHLEWQEQGDGRNGNIGVTLHFGTRDFADLAVIVPEEPGQVEVGEAKESCDGGGIVNFRRGFEVPAMPMP